MSTQLPALERLDVGQLKALRVAAVDQLQTATSLWRRAATANAPLADTLQWAGSINAAERRIDRINAELGRRAFGRSA